jgi:hypothetical protein
MPRPESKSPAQSGDARLRRTRVLDATASGRIANAVTTPRSRRVRRCPAHVGFCIASGGCRGISWLRRSRFVSLVKSRSVAKRGSQGRDLFASRAHAPRPAAPRGILSPWRLSAPGDIRFGSFEDGWIPRGPVVPQWGRAARSYADGAIRGDSPSKAAPVAESPLGRAQTHPWVCRTAGRLPSSAAGMREMRPARHTFIQPCGEQSRSRRLRPSMRRSGSHARCGTHWPRS